MQCIIMENTLKNTAKIFGLRILRPAPPWRNDQTLIEASI